ncbi:MAG: GTP cyclohydrolase I, partial [Bacteroidota bacterium]
MHEHDDNESGYRKIDSFNEQTTSRMSEAYLEVLKSVGEDPSREGLLKTPERVAKAMQFLTHGYNLNPEEILLSAKFREEYQQM